MADTCTTIPNRQTWCLALFLRKYIPIRAWGNSAPDSRIGTNHITIQPGAPKEINSAGNVVFADASKSANLLKARPTIRRRLFPSMSFPKVISRNHKCDYSASVPKSILALLKELYTKNP
jgi:hypothetical protein